jgi:hypothetical protein
MLRPSVLLPLLILLGLVGAGWAWFFQAENFDHPAEARPAPTPAQQLLAQNPLLRQPEVQATGEDPQIGILQAQVQYLEEQVKALRDENSALVDQLAKLGLKQGGSTMAMKAEAPPSDIPVDYISLGAEMLADRELEELPMPTVVAPQVDVEKVILAWLKRQSSPGFGQREGAAFAALGAIPNPIDTLPLRAALLARLIGGWYDDETSTLYLVDPEERINDLPTMTDPVLGIAYGNLLHHYQISLLPSNGPTLSTDERLARLGLLCGDAALQRFLRDLKQFKGPDPSMLPAEDPDHPLNQVPMPAFLRELELFPWTQGFFFAQAMHSLGGFKQVSTSYGRPPESTADVMDTERYLADQPAPLPRVEWASIKIEDTDPFWDDRLGPYPALAFLKRYNADEAAGEAIKGWVSDRFLAYALKGDLTRRGHAVWQTRWSTPAKAAAFLKALRECLTQFYNTTNATADTFQAQGRTLHSAILPDKHSVLLIDAATETFVTEATQVFE